MGRRTLAMAAALAAASLGACKSRTEVSPAKAAPAALSQGIDLGAVVRRVRRSFRPSGAALVSEGRTWRARLDGGALSVVPGGGTAGLVLGSATIGRVGSDPGPSGLPRRERDGAIAIERGTATERLLPADGGLEQSWTFRAPPPGKGELRVRIAASGLAYAGSSGSGLHFADRRTGLGVRFGHATFVDAAGVRTPVEARWRQGEIVLAVPAAAVDGAAYPAVLDPLLSPESGVDVPLLGGAPDAQRTPAVAFDGIRFLVAWVDRRSGEAGEIWAARVAADGTLLDPAGIPVATGDGDRPVLAAAAGGGAFLVAWQELPSEFQPRPFRAARLSGDGTLLDAAPVALGADGDRLGALAATFDGTEFRIAWSSSATFDPIRLSTVRLPVTGPPPGPAMVVRTGQAPVYDYLPAPPPAIACAGETCAVAWAPSGVLQAVPVSRSGVLPGLTVATAGADAPALSFDGAGYLLVWQDDRLGTGRPDVSAVRLDPTGALVGGGTFPLATGGARFTPAVAFDGAHHVVVWEERDAAGSDVLGTRVAPDGTIADAIFLPVAAGPGAQLAPAVAAGPGGALVAFEDTGADLSGDVAAARVGPDGMVLDPTPFLVSRSANRELRPAVAFDGTAWLVVWEDSRASGTRDADVYGARVAADGTVLDPAGFAISDTVAFEGHPAVAGCAGGWRVAWEDHRHGQPDVFAARVDPGGAVLDPAGIPVATGGSPKGPPAVACAGDLALVAWAEPGNGQWVPGRLAAARLLAGGKVLDPDGLALSARTSGEPPAVAAGGDGFAVAWSFLAPSGNGDLVTAFVPAQGAPGEAVLVCGAPSSRGAPSLAFDGGGFQLAFEDARAQPGQLRTARLSPAGAPLDGCGIELAGLAGGLEPRLAFDGTRHLLAFRDGGSGELRGAALAPGGGLLETFSIAPAADGQRAPAAACDGAGRCLVASERDDAALGVPRIRIRTAAFAAPAPRCAGPGDCPSGFCVDGVCCDSACGGGDPTDCIACSVAAGAPVDGTCAPALPGTLCQGGGGQCRQAARCDGASSACPATGSLPDGTACDDLDACTTRDTCQAGACVGTLPVGCSSSDTCYPAACDPVTGQCVASAKATGAPCDDGNACTVGDACLPGNSYLTCKGTPKACPAAQCQYATCDPRTGACGQVPQPDGSWCDDGSACTVADHCQAGVCTGMPVVCPAPDACHEAGLCDRATGQCTYANKKDGTACDDGNACTRTSACVAGACVGSDPVVCPAPDSCHVSACNPLMGTCSTQAKPDGAACDDGDKCTLVDACLGGICRGTPVTCAPPDVCHQAGACDPGSGDCVFPNQPDGTACDDGNLCTVSSACRAGACVGTQYVTCPTAGECQLGVCDPASGCKTAPAPDGAPCTGGRCQAGACQASSDSGDGGSGGGGGGGGGGCGCGSGGGADPALLAFALAALARRRRSGLPAR